MHKKLQFLNAIYCSFLSDIKINTMEYYHKRDSLLPSLVRRYYSKQKFNVFIKHLTKLLNTVPKILTQNILQQQSNTTSLTSFRLFYYFYLITGFVRANILAVLNHHAHYLQLYYQNYDVVVHLVIRLQILNDLSAMVVVSLLPLYAIFLDYLCHCQKNSEAQNIFKLAHEIIVINRYHFIRINFRPDQNPFKRALEIRHNKNVRLFYRNLEHFRTLPWHVRVELVLLSYLFDIILAIYQIFSAFLFAFIILFYLYKVNQYFGAVKSMVALVDMCLISYGMFNTGKVALFFLYIFNIDSIGEYRRLNYFARAVLNSLKVSSQKVQYCSSLLERQFLFYQREHLETYQRSVVINRCLLSRILLATLVANVACSVFVIFILFYKTIGPVETISLLGVLTMQVVFSIIAVLSAISLCSTMYRLRTSVNRVQLLICNVTVKWKLLVFYELIESKKKFYFSVGPLGKVGTKKGLLKVFEYIRLDFVLLRLFLF